MPSILLHSDLAFLIALDVFKSHPFDSVRRICKNKNEITWKKS